MQDRSSDTGRHRYRIMEAAEEVAQMIASTLEERLRDVYGANWLAVVNQQQKQGGREPGTGLNDERFCLRIFAYNSATEGWAPEERRRLARQLCGLANSAHHNDPLTDDDCDRASRIVEAFRIDFQGAPSIHGPAAQSNRAHGTGPRRGRDLEAQLRLDFEDAVLGITTSVRVTTDAVCSMCNGSGDARFAIGATCPTCRGSGMRYHPREIKIRLPPGVQDGQRIRARYRGNPGRDGGPPGDLYITCYVSPHSLFGRRKHDLTLTVPMDLPKLTSGTNVTVPSLDKPLTLRVPPGTPSGRTFRVKGRGVKTKKATGDLLVTVKASR